MPVLTAKEFEKRSEIAPAVSKQPETFSPKKAVAKTVWYFVHPDRGFVRDAEITVADEKLFIVDGYTKCETENAMADLLNQGYRLILKGK
jgi:hypothetical protein